MIPELFLSLGRHQLWLRPHLGIHSHACKLHTGCGSLATCKSILLGITVSATESFPAHPGYNIDTKGCLGARGQEKFITVTHLVQMMFLPHGHCASSWASVSGTSTQ